MIIKTGKDSKLGNAICLGITVIIITHDMTVIEEICGKVAILNHGVVAETGAVTDVFSHPKTEAGRRLVYPDGRPLN